MDPMRAMVAYLLTLMLAGTAGGAMPGESLPAIPAPPATAAPDQIVPGIARMLWRGMKGKDVRLMQARLGELGYLDDAFDGTFGANTEKAVKRFQYYHGLVEDGVAGADTLHAMFAADAAPAPPAPDVTLPPPPPTLPPATPPTPTLPTLPTATPPPTAPPQTPTPTLPTAPPSTQAPATEAPPTEAPPTEAPPTEAPPTEAPSVNPRPEILVVMDGTVLPVVAAQVSTTQDWVFSLQSLAEALGYTAAVQAQDGAYVYDLARLDSLSGETLEQIGLSFTLDATGAPINAMLLENDNVALLDAAIAPLVFYQNTLYVPIPFVERVLRYTVAVDAASIQIAR